MTDTGEGYKLGPRDVANQIGVSRDTVIAWADKGKLPCWRTPTGHRRFRQSDIDAVLAFGKS